MLDIRRTKFWLSPNFLCLMVYNRLKIKTNTRFGGINSNRRSTIEQLFNNVYVKVRIEDYMLTYGDCRNTIKA